jgi:L-amino acid N-acyltransferase YncA
MNNTIEIVTVDATNVEKRGFFCYKSKSKSAGYRQKLDWLYQRLAEGLSIKIVYENGRQVGFIEYVPGEYAWRAVRAANYMVIHCLWVVGRAKDKGYGLHLLNACMEDARQTGRHGVAMVTSHGNWLAGNKLFLKNGFEAIDQAPPSFELLVKRFDAAPLPAFPADWDARLSRYGSGLTVVYANQCPYIDNAIQIVTGTAAERGIKSRVVKLESSQQVQDTAPSAYGVFGVVYNGRLLTYHYASQNEMAGLLGEGERWVREEGGTQ